MHWFTSVPRGFFCGPSNFSSLRKKTNTFDLCSVLLGHIQVNLADCRMHPCMPAALTRCSRVLHNSASQLQVRMISLPSSYKALPLFFLNVSRAHCSKCWDSTSVSTQVLLRRNTSPKRDFNPMVVTHKPTNF